MKNIKIVAIALLAVGMMAFSAHSGGVYKTSTGNITFISKTPVEDISAENHKVKSAFDAASGKIQFSVLVRDFEFENALMQEHFNENYMNSDKYPRATFNGNITNVGNVKFESNGTYTSEVSGKLTIKDVTKEVTTKGTFTVKDGVVNAKAAFNINPEEYNIKIPKVVSEKISRDLSINVDADYQHAH